MAVPFIPQARRVLPNFRSFHDASALGELSSTRKPTAQFAFDDTELKLAWRAAPSIGLAADIISQMTVTGTPSELVQQASEFVVTHADEASRPLLAAAQAFLPGPSLIPSTTPLPQLTAFLASHNQSALRRRIGELRRALRRFPADAILYVELARLYLMSGQPGKATRLVLQAVSLAPTNRYVLRCAARLLARTGEPDEAFRLLHKRTATIRDPWLLSAELATAALIGREGVVMKRASRMLQSEELVPRSTTELASGVASVELAHGNRKLSRRLFQSALRAPNDNSLAQVEWALEQDQLFEFDVHSYNLPRISEALALDAFSRGQWANVLTHCEAWLMDMPFTRRPILMAFHTAAVALDDIATASLFCDAGLMADPHDQILLNNKAFALALQGEPQEALSVLDDAWRVGSRSPEVETCLIATRGLALFRQGDTAGGAQHYRDAIERAGRLHEKSYRQLALLHYIRELLECQQLVPVALADEARALPVESRSPALAVMKARVVALLDQAALTRR